ncbi:MAG TPA: dienelactone hydrolase family protein [Thermoanaerobaculia bacterium]|nr:dienelactone hydrolase family protein [Thermoanaerobaculia bacterium]
MPESIATKPLVLRPPQTRIRVRSDIEYAPGVLADVYAPDDRPNAAIIFIHGGPVPDGAQPKNMQLFRDYGALAASSGFAAMTFNHRFFGSAIAQATKDVEEAIEFACVQPEVDAERLIFWAFSGGGPFLSFGFDQPNVRALVSYYAILASPLERLRSGAHCPPMLIARAGKDHQALNASVDAFISEALTRNIELEVMAHPNGEHGFDLLNDDDRSRAIIRRTIDFIREHVSA